MNCANVFNTNIKKKESILYKELLDNYHKTDVADYIYENIVKSGVYQENSFLYFLEKKRKEGAGFSMTAQNEPSLETFLEWVEYVKENASVNRVFVTNNLTTSPMEFLSMTEGFSSLIPAVLKEKSMSFIDLVSSRTNMNNVWNATFDKFSVMLQDNIDKSNKPAAKTRGNLILQELKDNRSLFRLAYNEYLSSQINLKFDEVSGEFGSYNETISQSEDRAHKDSTFDKSSHEFSPSESAPDAIKMMIFTLTETDTNGNPKMYGRRMGLPRVVNFSRTSAMMHQALAEVPADINIFLNELKEKATIFPEMQQVIDQVNFYQETFKYSSDPIKKQREQLFRTQFVNQFNKAKYDYYLHIMEKDGNMKVINANLDKASDVKIRDWESNLLLQIASNPSKYTQNYINEKINPLSTSRLTNFEFMAWLGITPEAEQDAVAFYNQFGTEGINEIRSRGVANIRDVRNLYKNSNVKGRLTKLANTAVKNDKTIVELQHYNPEGKLVYGISLNTYLTNKIKSLKYYAGNEEMLQQLHPELYNDPYLGSSVFAQVIKTLADNSITIGISTGFKSDVNGKSLETSDLNTRDLTIQRMYNILQEGTYNFPRAADRKIENVLRFQGLRGRGSLLNGGGLIADVTDDIEYTSGIYYMLEHLADEIAANAAYPELGIAELASLTGKSTRAFTLKNGKNLFDTKDLTGKTYNDLLKDTAVVNFIKQKLKEIVAEEREGISQDQITKNDVKGLLPTYGTFDNIVANYALNSFFGSIEMTKLLTGDPAIYGDAANFFKRMSMLNSTKEATRVDEEMNSYIASLENNGELQQGYERGNDQGSIITSITLQDIKSDLLSEKEGYTAEEKATIEKILGKKNPYNSIDEGDGMAYITYDEYRIMKIRYGEWNDIDEELYQKITTDSDFVIIEDYYGRIIPDKSQFVGRLRNEEFTNFNIVGGRKFAFMPLIPGMYKPNSTLDKLNKRMLANGVGMAFFNSASKFGYKSDKKGNPLNRIYDENGDFALEINENSKEKLDYSDMGNQLKLTKDIDRGSYITESTQKRKTNYTNFLKGGKVRDDIVEKESLQDHLDLYDNIQKEKIDRAYTTLSNKLGFTADNRNSKLKKFVGSITNMGKIQGFTSNELKSLQTLLDTPYLDSLSNKARVEQFLMAKLKNGVIRQKRRGESLAQMSNIGFETGMSRHDLKFYREVNGRMLPMEVYAPLSKELMRYVSNKYNEGNGVTAKAINKFNQVIAKDNQNYEKTGKESGVTKLTMLVGFRIPNQGPSSSDVAKVKAFYPPHMGGMVMVPKALVVKAGSDFDIDKLNMYYPEIEGYDGVIRSFITRYFPTRNNIISTLQREDIGYNLQEESDAVLEKLVAEEILKADHAALNHPISKTLNELYNSELKAADRNEFRLMKENLNGWYINPKGDLSSLSKKQLNNLALENEIAITLHPANWKQLLTPLGDSRIKKVRDDMRKDIGTPAKETFSDMFLGKTNINKMISFLAGKAGVGQTAIHVTSHINSQKADLKMVALHSYFGVSENMVNPKVVKQDNVIPVKEINELVSKPSLKISFDKPSENLNFGDSRKWDSLIKKAKELENNIDRLWSEEKC